MAKSLRTNFVVVTRVHCIPGFADQHNKRNGRTFREGSSIKLVYLSSEKRSTQTEKILLLFEALFFSV